MKDQKVSALTMVLTAIILVALVVIALQYLQIKRLKNEKQGLSVGDTLPALDLISMDNTHWDYNSLFYGVTLFISFKAPCTACNPDISTFVNLKKYYGNKINILGVIPDGNQTGFQLQTEGKVNFPLYIPIEPREFRQKIRLLNNTEQIFLLDKNKIISVKSGLLSDDDVRELQAKIDECIKG